MSTAPSTTRRHRFGNFEVDVAGHQLLREGARVRIQDLPFRILVLLVERPGEVVTREELREKLWPADTFVEFDHSLNTAIKKLREALGDSADRPQYIETVPRIGYRFIGQREAEPEVPGAPQLQLAVPDSAPPISPSSPQDAPIPERRAGKLVGLAVLLTLLFSALAVYLRVDRSPESQYLALNNLRVSPITSLPGAEGAPSFSPDGEYVAFEYGPPGSQTADIYILRIGSETPLQFTDDPAPEGLARWSPDGQYVAFLRAGSRPGIYIKPFTGGGERLLYAGAVFSMAWAPDGNSIYFGQGSAKRGTSSLHRLSLDTLRAEQVLPEQPESDNPIEFSPDGSSLALIRVNAAGSQSELLVMRMSDKSLRRVEADPLWIMGAAWSSDGQSLIFGSGRNGEHSLWRVSAEGGVPEQLPFGGRTMFPAVSPKTNRLVFLRTSLDANIWRFPLSKADKAAPAMVIASSYVDGDPAISPDGQRIAFVSNRSGDREIWVANSDGSFPRQLTDFRGGLTGTPRWSPDGKLLTFGGPPGAVYIISADSTTRKPRVVVQKDALPNWSHDGKWIFYSTDISGSRNIWRVSADGGESIQITRNGGFYAEPSRDGKYIYFARAPFDFGIWRVPVEGGQEEEVLSPTDAFGMTWGYWTLTEDGIYMVTERVRQKPALEFYDFATRSRRKFMSLDHSLAPGGAPGFALSPDRKYVLMIRYDNAESDIMLVENFR